MEKTCLADVEKMKIKRETLLRTVFNYVAFIFLVCIMNDIVILVYPFEELHGLTNAQMLKMINDFRPLNVPFVFSAFVSVVCVYWMVKLKPAASILSGIITGVYFALLNFPPENEMIIEEIFLPVDPSLFSVTLYCLITALGVPIIVFEVSNRLVILIQKIWVTRDPLVVTE